MFFEKCGVSTVKAADLIKLFLPLLILTGVASLGSCGKKSGSGQDTTVDLSTQTEGSKEHAIEEMLNETIERLRYGDKSGLYENEFDYFTDETNFDDYLKMAQLRYAQADTITFVEVRHVNFLDRDSALVDVTVHFEGPTGKKTFLRDKIIVYWHNGRWIKPTVTVIDLQRDYENKVRVADSAAAAEAEEE